MTTTAPSANEIGRLARKTELPILARASKYFGVEIAPRKVRSPHGVLVDLAGLADDLSLIAVVNAQMTYLNANQMHRTVAETLKAQWARTWLAPDARVGVLFGYREAVDSVRGGSNKGARPWSGLALADLGVELHLFEPTTEIP